MENKPINLMLGLIVGLLFLGISLFYIYDNYVSQNWISGKASVVYSDIIRQTGVRTAIRYLPLIAYNYTYKGTSYNGKCCTYSPGDYASVQKMVNENPIGSNIEIVTEQSHF